MILSEKKQQAVYDAIHSVIMDTRVELRMKERIDVNADAEIAQCVHKIWRKVRKALNIKCRGEPDNAD